MFVTANMNVTKYSCRFLMRNIYRKTGMTYSQQRKYSQDVSAKSSGLLAQLQARIRFKGPITVADYMKEALTHAKEGYYINKDVFGQKGDFTTSPEISQMFGELVAIWFVNEWMQAGSPDRVQIVELGPGRGTMADDMMRAFSMFPDLKKAVSWHLVEISKTLSEMQETKLSGKSANQQIFDCSQPHYKSCVSSHGPEVFWYQDLQDVPSGLTFFVAHEFFDALPIHKFQKTDKGWREILVDIDPENNDKLRFVASPTQTVASTAFLQVEPDDTRDHVEICPHGWVVTQEIATRIQRDGGAALLIDYGHTGEKGDTFRGFKDHSLHDVLENPGTADLTADVDFSHLIKNCQHLVRPVGPVTQAHFLLNMGIGLRLKILYEKASVEEQEDLLSAYQMLTDPDQMGERFKFLALLNNNATHAPVGFDPLPGETSSDES